MANMVAASPATTRSWRWQRCQNKAKYAGPKLLLDSLNPCSLTPRMSPAEPPASQLLRHRQKTWQSFSVERSWSPSVMETNLLWWEWAPMSDGGSGGDIKTDWGGAGEGRGGGHTRRKKSSVSNSNEPYGFPRTLDCFHPPFLSLCHRLPFLLPTSLFFSSSFFFSPWLHRLLLNHSHDWRGLLRHFEQYMRVKGAIISEPWYINS